VLKVSFLNINNLKNLFLHTKESLCNRKVYDTTTFVFKSAFLFVLRIFRRNIYIKLNVAEQYDFPLGTFGSEQLC